jgi:putative transposase
MIELVEQREPGLPIAATCEALGVSRATVYRARKPSPPKPPPPRAPSPRKLSEAERAEVLEVLHSERFADQPPAEVYGTLLDEGKYFCSARTMHRILAERGESRERRDQRPRTHHPVPRLSADRPSAVWSWDISKLPTFDRGTFLNLYVVLDLYSRYVVAWMVAERENSALSKQLFTEAIERYEIPANTLRVHQDRGAPMRAHGFLDLLASLGVDTSHSRPRVSNDNAFSEALFKTTKSQPDYPGRFVDIAHARQWLAEFFAWYNDVHRHHGLALFTPADVFFGRVEEIAAAREKVLADAYAAHPERFVRGLPTVRRPAQIVHINPLLADDDIVAVEDLLGACDGDATPEESSRRASTAPSIVLPGVEHFSRGAEAASLPS